MMEARGRRVGGGFPGYSGPALPRAMRSARGRGESCRQPSDAGGRAGFFELLATVAGQFLQDASVGQEHETDKQKRPQFVESVLDTNSQTQSEEVQAGDSPQIEIGNSASADGDMWEQDIMLSTESTLPVGDAHSPAANSCQSNSAAGKTVNLSVVEDAVLASGVGLFSEVVSPQSTDVKENDPANSAGCRAECYVLQDVNVAQNPEGQLISADCYSGTAHTIEVENPAISLSEGRGLVNSSVSYDENCGMCKSGECLHNRRGVHLSEKGFCNIVREESHSCDITEQEHIEEQSKDSRGPNCDSCDGPVIIQEETVEQIISGPNPVKQVSDMVKDHGDVSVDVYMGTRNEIEDDVESNRCVCKADEKVSRSPCDEVEEKPITEAGNSLSVNVSSIEEVLGSEEGEQVGAQSKYNVHTGPGKFENGYHVSERKEGRILRGHSGDVSQKTSMKDSCSKVLKARKFAKAGKRSRICGSRTKRKRSEIEAQADADFVHGNKGIFGNIAFTRQRTPRPLQAKRKKMENETDDPLPDLDLSTKTADVVEGEPPAAAAKLRSAKAASVASSPTAGSSKNTCKKSGEPHVKLSIKSFTVPELFVDLPESATIANLKRAVMDAAMNLLGGGLRVRVLLQGKKIPDEGMSLGQMGISRHGKPDSLGFMLEPSPLPASPNAAEDPLLVLSRAASQPSQRYPVFSVPSLPVNGEGGRGPTKGRGNKSSSMVDADSTFAPMACDEQSSGDPNCGGISFGPTPDDLLKGCNGAKPKTSATERMSLSPHSTRVAAAGALAAIRAQADASRRPKTEADSAAILPHTTDDSLVAANGAIILHPGIGGDNLEGMALVPVRQKMRSVDTSKRRIRRPFSVTEVEALVHAVEKLGTGRWRDVKLRAFDQAKHRTYVDLKDKWKTLVHTARIAPHQRRGEPVPQELLERVTRAHTYWTAQQAKQQAELDF